VWGRASPCTWDRRGGDDHAQPDRRHEPQRSRDLRGDRADPLRPGVRRHRGTGALTETSRRVRSRTPAAARGRLGPSGRTVMNDDPTPQAPDDPLTDHSYDGIQEYDN